MNDEALPPPPPRSPLPSRPASPAFPAFPVRPARPEAMVPVAPEPPGEGEPWARRPVVRLRTPADIADLLPYLLGFHPTDSLVVLGLQGPRLQQGGTIRIDLPPPEQWPSTAEEVARSLLALSEQRDRRPQAVVLYLCQDGGAAAAERLRPLAQGLERAFGAHGVPVHEALCVSDGRWWSYRHPGDPAGTPLQRPGTTAVAAAAAYAGIQVRGTLRELHAELAPVGALLAEVQLNSLDHAVGALVEQLLAPGGPETVRQQTVELLESALLRFRSGASELPTADCARLILGLQDRNARDRAAEWIDPPDLDPASRLWRYLARRCVGPFHGHAAAPLALLGWTSWISQDEVTARVALAAALEADPEYTFAKLLYEAVNTGADPSSLCRGLRAQRTARIPDQRRGEDHD